MNKQILFMVFVMPFMIILSAQICHAETVNAKGEYILLETTGETISEAIDKAKMEARRAAIEASEVYVKSYSQSEGFQLTKDEITVISARIIRILNENVKKEIIDDSSIKIIVHIVASIDSKNFSLKELLSHKEELEAEVKRNNELTKLYNRPIRKPRIDVENYKFPQ